MAGTNAGAATIRIPPPLLSPYQFTPTGCFRLLELPPELVDLIYYHVLKTSDLAILRTSRSVNIQAFKVLLITAFLKIPIRLYGSIHNVEPSPFNRRFEPSLIHFVQNLEIHVLSSPNSRNWEERGLGPLIHFTDLFIKRRLCRIIFQSSMFDRVEMKPLVLLAVFKHLISFEMVAVIAKVGWAFSNPNQGFDKWDLWDSSVPLPKVASMVRSTYGLALREMEPALGPATWCESGVQGGQHLEFHPRKYMADLARESGESDLEELVTEFDECEAEEDEMDGGSSDAYGEDGSDSESYGKGGGWVPALRSDLFSSRSC